MVKHLASPDILQHEVDILDILKMPEEIDDKGALDLIQQPLLILCVVQLLHLDHLGLIEDLDGDVMAGFLVEGQHHAAKGPGPEGVFHFKVMDREASKFLGHSCKLKEVKEEEKKRKKKREMKGRRFGKRMQKTEIDSAKILPDSPLCFFK